MEYLLILISLLIVTFFSHKLSGVKIYGSKKEGLVFVIFLLIIGVIWDSVAIYREHWIFPEESLVGFKIGLMPIEEYLFVLIIPYFILVFYKIFTEKLKI